MAGQENYRVRVLFPTEDLERFTAVHIRQAYIEDDEVRRTLPGERHALCRCRRFPDQEFLMKGDLLGKGASQFLVVVDDQDVADLRHGVLPSKDLRRSVES